MGIHEASGKLFFAVNCKIEEKITRSNTLNQLEGLGNKLGGALIKNDLFDLDDENDDNITSKKFDFEIRNIKSDINHISKSSECLMISSKELHID